MNLPNKLTVSRFWLTGLFLWVVFARSPLNDTVALIVFCLAALTDLLDGVIARRRGLVTSFGMLMDPLADKILICSAFIALVERGRLNPAAPVTVQAWMAVLIVARELAITGLRLLAASKNVVLAAERFGKHKTIAQITAVIALLVLDAYGEWWPWLRHLFQFWAPTFTRLALWVALLLTATSGIQYLWRNRGLYSRDL
jgi:CDP-diacylglycerol---glycerol-3-phosphate 3-phosphatidyltransferase